jgi:hypothetical protein
MKRKLLLAVVAVLALLALGAGVVWAKGGFDQWGYNYQANMFNGLYWNYSRPETPCEPGTCASDTLLIMKWSDEWLNEDRVRCAGTPQQGSSACEGAWLTNHQRGEYVNDDGETCKWTYFVKIVYPPGGPVDDDGDGFDDITGGSIIWGSYVRIQQVSNDPCAGEHGNIFSVQPTGFGAYK